MIPLLFRQQWKDKVVSLLDSRPGLSIIVVTYRRMDAVYANLEALLGQDLGDIPSEIIRHQ